MMGYIGLDDKIIKNEYCSNTKGERFCSGTCYNDYYQCPHWKQEWITPREENKLEAVEQMTTLKKVKGLNSYKELFLKDALYYYMPSKDYNSSNILIKIEYKHERDGFTTCPLYFIQINIEYSTKLYEIFNNKLELTEYENISDFLLRGSLPSYIGDLKIDIFEDIYVEKIDAILKLQDKNREYLKEMDKIKNNITDINRQVEKELTNLITDKRVE